MTTKPKRPRDFNQLAKLIVDIAVGEASDTAESKKATAGRTGGIKGGVKRMAALSDEERKALALKAARARWDKKKTKKV
jgi:hypothetical protein